MKKAILITLLTFGLAAGGYWGWDHYFNEGTVEAWSLVPDTALTVYETDRIMLVWNELQSNPIWRDLLSIPYIRQMKERFEGLDALLGEETSLTRLVAGRQVLISSHLVGPSELDHLFIFPVSGAEALRAAASVRQQLEQETTVRAETRNYKDFTIYDLYLTERGLQFSYIVYRDHFLGSFSAVLVEDAIRNIEEGNRSGFRQQHSQLLQVSRLKQDAGNLYIDFGQLGQLASAFSREKQSPWLTALSQLARSGFLDLKAGQNGLQLNGFTFTAPGAQHNYLAGFEEMEPQALELADYLPDRSALVYHFTFDDPLGWEEQLNRYWEAHAPAHLIARSTFEQQQQTDLSELFDWFGGEIGLVTLESPSVSRPDRLAIFKTRDAGQALNSLNKLASTSSALARDTLYREQYANYAITQLYLEEFPQTLLGSPFGGFEQTFFSLVDGYIVLGNSVQVIKTLLDDRAAETTWGRRVRYTSFFDDYLTDSNLSLIIDTRRAWRMFLQELAPEWRQVFETHEFPLQNFSLLGLQFSYLDQKYYTSLALEYEVGKPVEQLARQFEVQQQVLLDTGIYTKPYVVKNHTTDAHEVILQDSAWYLHLIAADGELLWSDSIGEPIVSPIYQVDFYKNNKLQYLFATRQRLYLLDRLGEPVENYPLDLGYAVDYLSVVDYDNSKNYRWMLSSTEGSIYLYDKALNNLEGWNPRRFDTPQAAPPYHVRIRNRDCMVTMQENGLVYLLNRRGESMPGFPLDLQARVYNPLYVEPGAGFDKTVFTTVTEGGEVVRFTMLGEILNREQLYKPTAKTRFVLNINSRNRNFYIARQESDRLSMLGADGELLFEKDYAISSEILSYQAYDFTSGESCFPVNDQQQGFTYLYTQEGRLVNYQPINSHAGVALIRYESAGYTRIYHVYNRQLQISAYRH